MLTQLDAMALWLLGKPKLARERSASGMSLAEDLGHPYSRLESFNSALNIALLDGDLMPFTGMPTSCTRSSMMALYPVTPGEGPISSDRY